MTTSGAQSAAELVEDLASRGRYHFTTDEVAQALSVTSVAARAALRRLKAKGKIATPHRGFHVFLPPEYRRLGCLPPEQFLPQLLAELDEFYYVALLSAAAYHGAAHQRPQVFQVIVPKNRPGIACGGVCVEFVARHNAEQVPTASFNTPRGELRVATPEATAFDLVGYPDHAGGLDHVATLLLELADVLDGKKLVELAPASPTPWAQRLGYLLERVGATKQSRALADYVADQASYVAPLSPSGSMRGAPRDRRWRLAVNAEVEADL